MSRDLEKRLADWGVWYHQNKKRIPVMDLQKRHDFQEKVIDGLLELVAIAAEDIRTLEGRARSKSLWLPDGMHVTGDLKKFG